MIRALLISLLFCVSVHANDIYVEQAQEEPEETKVAMETETEVGNTYQQPVGGNTFEKSLIVPVSSEQYCSVVSGCYTKQ